MGLEISSNIILILSLTLLVLCILHSISTDFRSLIISNKTTLLIVVLFFTESLINSRIDGTFLYTLLCSLFVFLFFFTLFVFNLLGGGDVKLVASISLWLGPALLFDFLFFMSLIGGGIALIKILLIKTKDHFNSVALKNMTYKFSQTKEIPYGIAIGFSALIMIPRIYDSLSFNRPQATNLYELFSALF